MLSLVSLHSAAQAGGTAVVDPVFDAVVDVADTVVVDVGVVDGSMS